MCTNEVLIILLVQIRTVIDDTSGDQSDSTGKPRRIGENTKIKIYKTTIILATKDKQ